MIDSEAPVPVAVVRAPLSLRLAAYALMIFGFLGLIYAGIAAGHTGTGLAIIDVFSAANAITYGVSGLIWIVLATGLLRGARAWRAVAAILIGVCVGLRLALVLFTYWPLGPSPWNASLGFALVSLAVGGWLLWALTNVNTIRYCNRSSS